MAYLKFKLCRRLGENIRLTKKLTPKQHAIIRSVSLIKKNTNRKQSDFSKKLQQIKKLAYFYGMRSLKNHTASIQACLQASLDKKKSLLLALEVRLDVILVRIHFCPTLHSARQLIAHNKIYVNFHVVNTPGFRLRNGDIISILPGHIDFVHSNIKGLLKPSNASFESHPQNSIVPSYHIEVNYRTCNAVLLYEPVEIYFPYKIDLDFLF
jgi:ribosomal protein S4